MNSVDIEIAVGAAIGLIGGPILYRMSTRAKLSKPGEKSPTAKPGDKSLGSTSSRRSQSTQSALGHDSATGLLDSKGKSGLGDVSDGDELAVNDALLVNIADSTVVPTELDTPNLQGALTKSRSGFGTRLSGLFRKSSVDEVFWQDLEEALILSDVGLTTTTKILESSRQMVREAKTSSPEIALGIVRDAMVQSLSNVDRTLNLIGDSPVVILFVGVNGVGKTTTIGKVAALLSSNHKLLFAAADTFRAAATDQLSLWADRAGVGIVSGAPGGDPAAVLFDAISSARAKGIDIVLADTAGRLQNKTNLIEELKKVYRTIEKAQGTIGEVLLILDATTGQNGLSQAKVFGEAVGVTGVVLTKLDGSAKGGIAFAIEETFGIPVKLVGIGESIGDLVAFDPRSYVESLTQI